jgi:hypothetical protein
MCRRFLVMLCLVLAASTTPLWAHDPMGFDGTVVKLDAKKGLLTIKVVENGQPADIELTLDSKMARTTITQAGKKVSRSALKAGQRVKVSALGCIDEVEIDAVDVQILPPGSSAPTDHAMHMAMPTDGAMAGMTMTPTSEVGTEIPKGDPIPTVALRDDGVKNGVWSFSVVTSLVMSDARKMKPYQPMHGHLHIYLDDKEILMISAKRFTLKDLTPGTHRVKVVLSGTDHYNLLHEGKLISDSREIVVKP